MDEHGSWMSEPSELVCCIRSLNCIMENHGFGIRKRVIRRSGAMPVHFHPSREGTPPVKYKQNDASNIFIATPPERPTLRSALRRAPTAGLRPQGARRARTALRPRQRRMRQRRSSARRRSRRCLSRRRRSAAWTRVDPGRRAWCRRIGGFAGCGGSVLLFRGVLEGEM